MKVSKEDAEEYLKAFKSLEGACKNISEEWHIEIEEFGDIKVGDIYYNTKSDYYIPSGIEFQEDPKKRYYVVNSISYFIPGNLREIKQVDIIFYPLCSKESRYRTLPVHKLEESSFKKIRYLKGRCSLFKGDKCKFEGETYKVHGFLIDDPLVLISNEKKIYALYPNEIESL